MSIENIKAETLNIIKMWRDLVSEIELNDKNIKSILKCLDFSYMYDTARDLKIVKGYLFSEENKTDFMDVVNKVTNTSSLVERERKQLMELLSLSPEDYLKNLLIPVKTQIIGRGEVFTEHHERSFYEVMQVVGKLNISAINKFLVNKAMI